jgi:hypothetical protein
METEKTVFCHGCQKYIIPLFETYVQKNERWDLVCLHCDNWIGGMKEYYGWEIDGNDISERPTNNNGTMCR